MLLGLHKTRCEHLVGLFIVLFFLSSELIQRRNLWLMNWDTVTHVGRLSSPEGSETLCKHPFAKAAQRFPEAWGKTKNKTPTHLLLYLA